MVNVYTGVLDRERDEGLTAFRGRAVLQGRQHAARHKRVHKFPADRYDIRVDYREDRSSALIQVWIKEDSNG